MAVAHHQFASVLVAQFDQAVPYAEAILKPWNGSLIQALVPGVTLVFPKP
jgi:hypothetical protein